MVTGHRIPNALSIHGKPVNLEVLDLMAAGSPASMAVQRVMAENPEVDAGLLAIDTRGNTGMQNSAKVTRSIRSVAYARRSHDSALVEVLLNEIFPPKETAELAAAVALDVMRGPDQNDGEIIVGEGVKVAHANEDLVYVDAQGVVEKVLTTDQSLLEGRRVGIVPYMSSKIIHGSRVIGRLSLEAIAVLEDGVIKELDGQAQVRLPFRRLEE